MSTVYTGPRVVMLHTPLSPAQVEAVASVSPHLRLLPPEPVEQGDKRGVRLRLADRLQAHPETEIVFTTHLPEPWRPGGALKWVQLASAGVDHEEDAAAWGAPGVVVTSATGIHGAAMSQWAIAMILHHAHQLGEVLRYRETRVWPPNRVELSGRVLLGATLGIVGYGSVGAETARLGRALGMRVLATRGGGGGGSRSGSGGRYVPRALSERSAFDERVELLPASGLERLLSESDYVVITVPLSAATRGMIGAAQLARMKPSAFVVNVSRGAVVDEAALDEALRDGRLAGAALDVFETEPLPPDSPLFDLPNVVLSPHMSGNFAEYWAAATDVFCTNLGRYLDGEALLNVADRERGY